MTFITRRNFMSACGATALATRTRPVAAQERGMLPQWPSNFPALGQTVNGRQLVYLDSAATTLRPQSVIDALSRFYSTDNANPSRVHSLAARAADHLDRARQTAAHFLHANGPAEVIFVRGTTEGVNLVASTWGATQLRKGDEVVLPISEHNSNLMPWTRAAERAGALVRIAHVDEEGRLTPQAITAVMSTRTRLVAFSHVSNVLGFVNPAREITVAAKAAGATVAIDGAQAAPHVSIDVRDIGCDFYVFSGHKMLGPMGSGVVWGRRELLDAMPPYHVGSNMAHAVTFSQAELEHGAAKYQAGTPDVAGPIGLAAAMDFFERAGEGAVHAHDQALVRHGLARLRAVPNLRLIGPTHEDGRVPVFTFTVSGLSANAVAAKLDQQGIALRAGDMAALPLLKQFGVNEAVRASAYVYTSADDLDRLAEALTQVVRGLE
jgi:cysteine desulfurase / selenocysteine lyase